MFFEIFSDDLTLAVDGVSRIAVSRLRLVKSVYENNGIASLRRFLAGFKECGTIFMMSVDIFLACHAAAGYVAVLGENDKIHALVALREIIEFILKILFAFRIIHRIRGLNNTSFHRSSSSVNIFYISSISQISLSFKSAVMFSLFALSK
jgi:hypothetical protein